MKLKTSLRASVAVALLTVLPLSTVGCSSNAQLTTTQVVAKIDNALPQIKAYADAADAIAASLDPNVLQQIAITSGGATFDGFITSLKALCDGYLQNPSAGALAQIQTAFMQLSTTVGTTLLNSLHIVDPTLQARVKAAFAVLAAAIAPFVPLVANTMTVAQLTDWKRESPAQLARIRPLLDGPTLHAMAAREGVDIDKQLDRAQAFGF